MRIEGTAVIRESERTGHESANQGEPWPWEIGLNHFGTRKYVFTLEVTLPGEAPYVVEDRFKVPRKAENLGLFDAGRKIPAGVELPVSVDPRRRDRVEIDWERWRSSPGRKEAMRAGRAAAANEAMRRELDKKPKLRDKLRADNRTAGLAWAEAVRMGNMSREDLERQLTLEVASGRMDPADAEAARRAAGG